MLVCSLYSSSRGGCLKLRRNHFQNRSLWDVIVTRILAEIFRHKCQLNHFLLSPLNLCSKRRWLWFVLQVFFVVCFLTFFSIGRAFEKFFLVLILFNEFLWDFEKFWNFFGQFFLLLLVLFCSSNNLWWDCSGQIVRILLLHERVREGILRWRGVRSRRKTFAYPNVSVSFGLSWKSALVNAKALLCTWQTKTLSRLNFFSDFCFFNFFDVFFFNVHFTVRFRIFWGQVQGLQRLIGIAIAWPHQLQIWGFLDGW